MVARNASLASSDTCGAVGSVGLVLALFYTQGDGVSALLHTGDGALQPHGTEGGGMAHMNCAGISALLHTG